LDPAVGRLGIIGGSFDPIHYGHLMIAEQARFQLQLDQVLFVPAHVSPLKMESRPASSDHRCRMVQLAIADNPAFALSRVDLDRPAPSYTVDTLRLLRQDLSPDAEMYFIVGADSVRTLLHWRQPDVILRLCRLAMAPRPGHRIDLEPLRDALPQVDDALVELGSPELSVSSSDLRQRVGMGSPIRYQVPPAVESYIRTHDLYRRADVESWSPPHLHPSH
jgi:nicotinate-nucleotide adenylyltransferase